MFGDLPAYGLYCRHVVGLTVDGIDLSVAQPDARPAVVLDQVRDVDLRAMRAMPPVDGGPTLWMHAVQDGHLRELRSHASGPPVIRVSGAASSGIRVLGGSNATADRPTVVIDGDVLATALQGNSK